MAEHRRDDFPRLLPFREALEIIRAFVRLGRSRPSARKPLAAGSDQEWAGMSGFGRRARPIAPKDG